MPPSASIGLPRPDRRDQVTVEALVIGGVDHRAELGGGPDLGQRPRQLGRAEAEVVLAPKHRQRHQVALGFALAGLGLDDQQLVLVAGQGPDRLDRDPCNLLGLVREPALAGHEGRQRVALEQAPVGVVCEGAFEAASGRRNGHVFGQRRRGLQAPARRLRLVGEQEPEEAVCGQREHVGQVAGRRERLAAGQLDRHRAAPRRQVELHRLRLAREIVDAEDALVLMLADIGEDLAVVGIEEGEATAAEDTVLLAHRDQPAHPVEQRVGLVLLGLDVDRLVAVDRIHHRRQVERLGIGAAEAAVAVCRPLHRRPHAVAIAEIVVVAHADLVAVVDHRRAGHGEQQGIHQLDLTPVVVHQRRKPAADAEIDAGAAIVGVGLPQVVALLRSHHLERQLVMVPEEDRPLAVVRDIRRLADDVGDRMAILLRQRHVHARHQRKVERHVAFVAIAEIGPRILGPLVGLRQEQPVWIVLFHFGAELLQHRVRLRQVLVVGAVALDQVRDRVETQPVDAHIQPVVKELLDLLHHLRIVEVEVGLVRVEAVPEEGLCLLVPGPVRFFGVDEDDPGLGVAVGRVAPHVEIPRCRAGLRLAGPLEPGMLVGGVVDDEFGDDPQPAPVRLVDEAAEVAHRAVGWVDRAVVGNVVTVVAQRRGIERHQPDRIDAERGDVIEPLHQPTEVAHSVIVGILESLDVHLVDDGVLVPVALRPVDQAILVPGASAPSPRYCTHCAWSPKGLSRQMA